MPQKTTRSLHVSEGSQGRTRKAWHETVQEEKGLRSGRVQLCAGDVQGGNYSN